MTRNGFVPILIFIVIAVVSAGIGGYVLVSRNINTKMPSDDKAIKEESPEESLAKKVVKEHLVEKKKIEIPAQTQEESPPQQKQPAFPAPKAAPQANYDIHEDVWTKNGYDGASYEFKVNCGPNYKKLEECFLWDLSAVSVKDSGGKIYELAKDFNIQTYSGEITRRWVLYGPAGAGFPARGMYTFMYYRDGKLVHTKEVDYQPNVISYPTGITWRRESNDLVVSWKPPQGMKQGMWYKVLVFRKQGQVISQVVSWDASDARLMNVPLTEGEKIDMNVSSYFNGGYAYPQNISIVWTSAVPKSAPTPTSLSPSSQSKEIKPVLKNLGVSFEPWDKTTNRAGAFLFLPSENKVFLEYGVEVASSEGGTKILPTFEYRTASDADVFAALDGIVTNVTYQERNQDYSIHIQPELNSQWILEHDHVRNPRVSRGDTVKAGNILGRVGTLGGDLGRTEIMLWSASATRPITYCPFKYFDPGLMSEYQQKIVRHMKDWEEFKGNSDLYNEEKHFLPGCVYETLLD